jgi:hypothetical protein
LYIAFMLTSPIPTFALKPTRFLRAVFLSLILSVLAAGAPSIAQATFTILGPFPIVTSTYGVGSIAIVPPTTNSPAPWAFTSSNNQVATISGRTMNVVGVGTSTITASQAATGNYTARSRSTQIRVSQGSPVLGAFAPQSVLITDRTYTIVAPTSTSDGYWSYISSNSNIASVIGNKVTFHAGGSVVISATQTSTPHWKVVSTFMKFTVLTVPPVLGSFSNVTIGKDSVSSLNLNSPKSTSPGTWIFASSNPSVASINANIVTPLTFGTTTITATQGAFGDFSAATATMTLTVQGPTPTPTPTVKPTPTPTPTVKPTPTPTPTVKPTPTPTPTPGINATIKVTATGRALTVVAIGVKALVFINGKPGKVGQNPVAPGIASIVITIDDKVVYRRVFIIK